MIVQLWTEVLDDETRALLAERPDRPGLGKRPALIAVDLYDLVYDGGARPVHELMDDYPASCGEFAWNALPATVDLYAVLRKAGIPIIHVTYDTRAETDPKRVHPTNRKRRQPDLSLYKIKEELTPLEGELVVYKKRASAFFGTPLCAYLNEMTIDSIILIGESTSGCLRSSVVEAWSYGYPVTVVADSVFDRHGFINKVNLLDLHLKYATVMPFFALAAEIERRPMQQV